MIVHLIFYFFAMMAVLSALVVISVSNPVRSVLALVVTFFSMAAVWMILSAEFLSLILLLVYVGAVMTLFLFVVMMLNMNRQNERLGFKPYLAFGVLVVLLMLGLILLGFDSHFKFLAAPLPPAENFSNLTQLGSVLYTDYAYPFELAGVLLLAAIVAAISLAHRIPKLRKTQKVSAQLSVRPRDRLRLVKMPSEKKNDHPE